MTYFDEVAEIAGRLDEDELSSLAQGIATLKGRLFIVGLGGSAANASHAAADFRRLCAVEAHCLSDNVAQLTALANDDGWREIYSEALLQMRPSSLDALLVLSVGGGTPEVSLPLVSVIDLAKRADMKVLGIVGRDGGYTRQKGDAVVIVPTVSKERVTPHTEAFQSVILHYLVSHPSLQTRHPKW